MKIYSVQQKLNSDTTMHPYELLYIVGTQYTDTEVGEIQQKIAAILEKNGAKVLRNENLGKIRLAYMIDRARHGSYILVHFDSEPSSLKEINRQLGMMEEILRHTLITRPKGAETKKVELTSYVAPLSDEAKEIRDSAKRIDRVSSAKEAPAKVDEISESEELPTEILATSMSMEDLDKKLDEILEGDLTENI